MIVFLLHFSDCVITSASQYKYKEEEACLARALFCSFAFHQLQLFSRNRLATWIFPLNISIGNLNIPRSSTCKWQSLLQSFRHCKWYSEYKLNSILFVKWSFCKSSIQARIWQIAKSWYHPSFQQATLARKFLSGDKLNWQTLIQSSAESILVQWKIWNGQFIAYFRVLIKINFCLAALLKHLLWVLHYELS